MTEMWTKTKYILLIISHNITHILWINLIFMIRLILWIFEKILQSLCITLYDAEYKYILLPVILTLVSWWKLCFPAFTTIKLAFFPLHTLFFGNESLITAHTQAESSEVNFIFWRGQIISGHNFKQSYKWTRILGRWFVYLTISFYSLRFLLIILIFISWSFCSNYYSVVVMAVLYFPPSFYIQNWNFTVRFSCFSTLLNLFNYWFILIWIYEYLFYMGWWFNITHYFYLWIFQCWPVGTLWVWFLCQFLQVSSKIIFFLIF